MKVIVCRSAGTMLHTRFQYNLKFIIYILDFLIMRNNKKRNQLKTK